MAEIICRVNRDSELDDGVDPVPVVGYPRHHPRLVPLGAAYTPGDDAGQVVPSVLSLHGHWSTGVPLEMTSREMGSSRGPDAGCRAQKRSHTCLRSGGGAAREVDGTRLDWMALG